MDERLPDTDFHQNAESLRVNWMPDRDSRVAASYVRTDQDGADRYDQLLGGDGDLISELNDLSLDLFSVRLERLALGSFQYGSIGYALNSQREERVNQGGQGSSTATIAHEPERTTVHAVSGSVSRQVSTRTSFTIGGDVNLEGLSSQSVNINPNHRDAREYRTARHSDREVSIHAPPSTPCPTECGWSDRFVSEARGTKPRRPTVPSSVARRCGLTIRFRRAGSAFVPQLS
jgi:hypothetical protein